MPPSPDRWTDVLKDFDLPEDSELKKAVKRRTKTPNKEQPGGLPKVQTGKINNRKETVTTDGKTKAKTGQE
jgi:hypothetical protein